MTVSEDTGNAPVSVAALVYQPALDRMRQVPGVESAALVTSPPLSGIGINSSFDIVGQPKDPANKPDASVSAVSGDYAKTLGTPVIRGRMIGDGDVRIGAASLVVINESLARKYFRGQRPYWKADRPGRQRHRHDQAYTIVGILGDQVDQDGRR